MNLIDIKCLEWYDICIRSNQYNTDIFLFDDICGKVYSKHNLELSRTQNQLKKIDTKEMRSLMRSISSNPDWNEKKWSIVLGMNYFKHYTISKNIYLDQSITQPQNRKEKDLKIYYFDGFLKNSNQFSHIKRIASQYSSNLYYVDTLQFILYDLFSREMKSKKDTLIQSIKTQNSIFICSFDSMQILNKHLFEGSNLKDVDLIAISPYYQNYKSVNSTMQKQFLYNIQKSIVSLYSQLDNQEENDYLVQKYMNFKEFQEVVKEMKLGNLDITSESKPIVFKSLNVLSQLKDKILFQNNVDNESGFKYNLEKTYELYDTQGYKTQYLLNYYSPVMSLLYNDPSAIVLEQLLKEKFTIK